MQTRELDSSNGINDWVFFDRILRDYFAAGHGRHGNVGAAESHLLDAEQVVQYAVEWMEHKQRDTSKGHEQERGLG